MVGQPQPPSLLPQVMRSPDAMRLLWAGVDGVLENARGEAERSEAVELLRECSLALGTDRRLWPSRFVYRADEVARELFSGLLPHVSFLDADGISLFGKLCSSFVARSAIQEMNCLDTEHFRAAWDRGVLDPASLLRWFDGNKAELITDGGLRESLAAKSIFPSADTLKPLEGLWLPGGFQDPLRVAELLDTSKLRGLSDFLSFLGARELTFKDYVRRYVPREFQQASAAGPETRRQLVHLLVEHSGQIMDEQTKNVLAGASMVECTDGEFRQPRQVYLPTPEVRAIFDGLVPYAIVPAEGEKVAGFYRWLGVSGQPRAEHVIELARRASSNPPVGKPREVVARDCRFTRQELGRDE